jgi:hypothetical protein
MAMDNTREKSRKFDGPCTLCGKPGYVQALPGVPVSDIRCEDCARIHTFNPIAMLMPVVMILGIGLLIRYRVVDLFGYIFSQKTFLAIVAAVWLITSIVQKKLSFIA